MPWHIDHNAPALPANQQLILKSVTFVYQISFLFADGSVEFPVVNNKLASMMPEAFVNSNFYAALIFIASEMSEHYGTSAVITSTLMTCSNLIVAGIKSEVQLLRSLWSLIIALHDRGLPVPIFTHFEVIDITVCNKYPCTVLINRIHEAATPGFTACFVWNFKLFPAEDIHTRLFENSDLRLEEHFRREDVEENAGKELSIKSSCFKLNSCGGKSKEIVLYVHKLLFDYINAPQNLFTVPKIILDVDAVEARRAEAEREDARYRKLQQLANIRHRNRLFFLFWDVYIRYWRDLISKGLRGTFNASIT